MNQYNGKFVGIVEDNNDPDKLGRLKIRVPSVYGNITLEAIPWAVPDFPFSSENQGFVFIPDKGALVTVEFLNGSIYTPVWSGAVFRKDENVIPQEAVDNYPDVRILKTKVGFIKMDDKENVIEIKHKSGSSIIFTDDGDIVLHAKRDIIPYADRYFLGMPKGCEAAVPIPEYKNNAQKSQMTETELADYNQQLIDYNASMNGNCGKNGIDLYNSTTLSREEVDSVVKNDIAQQSQIVSEQTSKANSKIGSIQSLDDINGFMIDDIRKTWQNNAESLGVSDTPHLSSFDSMIMIQNGGDIDIER